MKRHATPAVLVAAVVFLFVLAVAARSTLSAQSPARGAAGVRSTLSGVYTTAQAARGENTYANICVSCHPFITYTGDTFRQHWLGKTVFDLFDQVSQLMPKNEPGSLTQKEYADVIAFILQLNKMPAGKTDLPTDPAALRRIKIELK